MEAVLIHWIRNLYSFFPITDYSYTRVFPGGAPREVLPKGPRMSIEGLAEHYGRVKVPVAPPLMAVQSVPVTAMASSSTHES